MRNRSIKKKECISEITLYYRLALGGGDQAATLRAFASCLSEALAPHNRQISHQSIKNWTDKRYIPDPSLMRQIAEEAIHDWRGNFAKEILSVIEGDNKKKSNNQLPLSNTKTLK